MLAAVAVFAQDIISAKEAAGLLKNDEVVIVSARTPSDYSKVHIPGAVNIDHKSLYAENSMLADPSNISSIFGENGISNNSKVLIYDDGSMKYSGRVYWIMKYMGVNDVKVIDAGMKGWRMARKPVTKNPTNVESASFTPKPNASIISTMNQVQRATNNNAIVLLDVRSEAEYNGQATTKLRPGHIPTAVNLEYLNVLNSDGTLKSKEELKGVFTNAGITPDKEIILYCETSVRAGIVFLALKSGLNYPKVRVYDGAYLEWQSDSGNTIQEAE